MIYWANAIIRRATCVARANGTKGDAVMNQPDPEPVAHQYTSMDRGSHSLHECRSAEEFAVRFEASTGHSVGQVVDEVVSSMAPKAVFAVGSLPLGMGTSGSDVDLIVLVDDKTALANGGSQVANKAQRLQFSSDSDSLLAGIFLTMHAGILVDLHVAVTPAIRGVYSRLRRRGPELSETEIRTLGRISTGWLLWQSDGYLERNSIVLSDPTLAVYCCTRHFVSALHQKSKAARALDCQDIPLALQHGRSSVEMAYLAYLASEGFAFLGSKWLAQIGHARGAAERVSRHPLLKYGVSLLFPSYTSSSEMTTKYLNAVSEFLTSMRTLIEQRTLFRIAFSACAQMTD
jgi:hypothetical protein